MNMRSGLRVVLLAVCLAAISAFAEESEDSTGFQVVTFDHAKATGGGATVNVNPGEPFVVRLKNTVPTAFKYEVAGVPWTAAFSNFGEEDLPPVESKDFRIVHDPQFGGYVIQVTSSSGKTVRAQGPAGEVELNNAIYVVRVNVRRWEYELAGGFTASGLTDPVYAVEERPKGDQTEQIVVEDADKEDDQRLGLAGMVHLYHTAHPWAALSFGLGISEDSQTTYYLGPTYRFGDKGALTFGIAAGSVARLPSGVQVGDVVDNANGLTTLPTRVDQSWFVGLSYTFVNPKDLLTKPFASTAKPAGAGAVQPPAQEPKPSEQKPPDQEKPGDGDTEPDPIDPAPPKTGHQNATSL